MKISMKWGALASILWAPMAEGRGTDQPPHLAVFAGSARQESLNKKLAKEAARLAHLRGAKVTFIDLADYPMPLYNGDLEDREGIPESAQKLKNIFETVDGFLIVNPEYNSSLTPLLVNTIAWVSRPSSSDEEPLRLFKNKVAGIVSASPGAGGGQRAVDPLRMLLQGIRVTVVDPVCSVGKAHEKFDAQGLLIDEDVRKQLDTVVEALIKAS